MELEVRTVSSVKATKGEPVAAIAGRLLREDVAGAEVQVVATCGIIQSSGPIVAVARLTAQSTIAVAASAH